METSVSIVLALYLAMFSSVSAQAPGDHDDFCRTGTNTAAQHIFPPEVKILMDTYDYLDLYEGFNPPWIAVSVDGDSSNWDQSVGGLCTYALRVCTRQPTGQNNWLFSQHIRYVDANEVLFNVSYTFVQCTAPSCTRDYVTLYGYQSDSIANQQRNLTTNYQPLFGSVESSRLQQSGSTSQISRSLRLTRPANRNGFYLGVRDEGTCGQVDRIIAHYLVCPSRVDGLVTYPETALPPLNSPNIIFDARCANNSENTTTLEVRASSNPSGCSPVAAGGPVCRCNAGFILSGDGRSCPECSAGTYRTLSDSSCQQCPSNTMRDAVAAPVCRCVDGFYRNDAPQEGPEIGCTAPPTACLNLVLTSRTDRNITLRWSQPTTTGRDDFFYRVLHSVPDNIGEFVTENAALRDESSVVTYTVTGLVPSTSYILRVTTHNGVSDQDPDSHLRMCEVSNMTLEGVPGPPFGVQRLCTAIVWQEPMEPNGRITEYNIRFSSDPDEILMFPPTVNFFVTDEHQMGADVMVEVRASTSAGPGIWTTPGPVCPSLTVSSDSSRLFSNSSGVELAIVAVCTFILTLAVTTLLFVCIGYCVFRKKVLTEKSTSRSFYSDGHELK